MDPVHTNLVCTRSVIDIKLVFEPGRCSGLVLLFYKFDMHFSPFPLKYIKKNSTFKRYKYNNVDT